MTGTSQDLILALLSGFYLTCVVLGLIFDQNFRQAMADWLSLRDPFGRKLWTANRWYAPVVAITLIGILLTLVLL